ncbi:MAG: site-specific integrase [Alphaproteobacteria bacterium]|nr:site-specific integrase [Alphaproteobacteria bacterium]
MRDRYVVTWHDDSGKRRRHRLDAHTRKEAESAALDKIRQERAKADKKAPTVKGLWDRYREEKAGRPIAATMGFEWKAIGPYFGHLRPDQITTDICRSYVEHRREKGRKDGTIWTELGHVRIVLVWAQAHGLIHRAPPIERPKQPAPKDRWLNHAEITRLLAAECEPHNKLAIHLMLATAGRIGAILELTWDRVDLDRRQINLRVDSEGPRKGRAVVPINAGLLAALTQAQQLAITGHVIEFRGKPVKSIKKGFAVACKSAGLDDVTPHTLRHTAAVHMAAAGVPMEKIAQYLGHNSVETTRKVYARFAPDHLRDEADILDFTKIRVAK